MTTRRQMLLALAALGAAPVRSQQPGKVWRIGFLLPRERPASLDTGATGVWIKSLGVLFLMLNTATPIALMTIKY